MSWKNVSFILSAPFYEMLLDLEQQSCGDERSIIPLLDLPLALYREHISERVMPFCSFGDCLPNVVRIRRKLSAYQEV